MSRRKYRKQKQNPPKELGKNKHHPFPKRDHRHKNEIKVIDIIDHRNWHFLIGDMKPEQAVRFIARNFLPTELEILLIKAIQ